MNLPPEIHGRTNPSRRWIRRVVAACIGAFALLSTSAEEPSTPAAPLSGHAEAEGSAADLRPEQFVTLPPYVVSAIRLQRKPWRYVALPGIEVLTRATETDTYWLLDALRRGQWLEDHVLPAEWLPAAPVPYTVIIDDTDVRDIRRVAGHTDPIAFEAPDDAFTWGIPRAGVNVWADRFKAFDSDTFALNTNVHDVDTTTCAYGWISTERLGRCAPPLPRWLIYGLLDREFGMFREGFIPLTTDEPEAITIRGSLFGRAVRRVVGPGTLWVSLEETKRLQKEFEKDRRRANKKLSVETVVPLIPLRQVLDRPAPNDGTLPLWKSEAALFVRWGLTDAEGLKPGLRAQFVRFAERARREPVNEAMFTDCFGTDFAWIETELNQYLRQVIARPVSLDPQFPDAFPAPPLKRATADQIGRILADWLRMQSESLTTTDPAMSAELLNAAGTMLVRAYQIDNGLPPDVDPAGAGAAERGSAAKPGERVVALPVLKVSGSRIHDADLLATFGLYEHDAGHDEEARGYLERAVRGGAARPRARLVLAQLRYADALDKPAGLEGKFSRPQAAHILEPLPDLSRAAPNLELYALVVNTWARCTEPPSLPELAKLAEAAARYPRLTPLTYRTAVICALAGDLDLAGRLVQQGLKFATDDKARADLQRLGEAVAHGGTAGASGPPR